MSITPTLHRTFHHLLFCLFSSSFCTSCSCNCSFFLFVLFQDFLHNLLCHKPTLHFRFGLAVLCIWCLWERFCCCAFQMQSFPFFLRRKKCVHLAFLPYALCYLALYSADFLQWLQPMSRRRIRCCPVWWFSFLGRAFCWFLWCGCWIRLCIWPESGLLFPWRNWSCVSFQWSLSERMGRVMRVDYGWNKAGTKNVWLQRVLYFR